MNLHISSRKNGQRGSALLIVMVTGTLMLLSLAGYLTMVNHQNFMSTRSQAWNTSIAVVEAGIEEAMEHLNQNTNRLGADGWAFDGARYVLDYDMGDGTGFSVTIDNMTDPENPEIVSKAFSTLDGGPITPVFGAIGVTENPRITLTRAVKVRASRGGLFIKGMVAKRKIDMNGNNILADSYDSGDPNKSTGQQYDVTKAGNKGDVSVNSSILNALNVGNANIYGHAATGPRGTVAIGSNGGIGEHVWVASNPGKVQPGWLKDDMNFTFPEPHLPFQAGLSAPPGDIVTIETVVSEVSHSGPAVAGAEGVITNVNYSYVNSYPGAMEGLTTNIVWENTLTPPASGTYTGNIITNLVQKNDREWPGNSVGTITTNFFWNSSKTYPGPQWGLKTNVTFVSGTTPPYPLPLGGVITNTEPSRSKPYPATGTYLGTPVKITGWWHYNLIVGYTWRLYDYSWPTREYVWNENHYIYQTATYGVPSFTYSWNDFTTNYVSVTNHYDHILQSGNYVIQTLSGKTYVGGDAQLVVRDDIRMSGNDQLTISKNGKLHVYVDGNDSAISGNGVINKTGLAENCIIEFTRNVQYLSFDGNGEFVGVIIAPYSTLDLNGGGSAITDFCGAVIGDIISLRGHFKFHYDEALGRLPRNGRYIVNCWDEIRADTAFGTISMITSP